MTKKVKVKQRSVNSKQLFETIHGTITAALNQYPIKWESESGRNQFCDAIEDYLELLDMEGEIQQPKVICDNRNNKSFASAKEIIFEVFYKQPHCLNTTVLEYHVTL